jgi:hypothetical protein
MAINRQSNTRIRSRTRQEPEQQPLQRRPEPKLGRDRSGPLKKLQRFAMRGFHQIMDELLPQAEPASPESRARAVGKPALSQNQEPEPWEWDLDEFDLEADQVESLTPIAGGGAGQPPPPLIRSRAAWEPGDGREWERYDPLGPVGDWPPAERSLYDAEALFYAWDRLPEFQRAQSWRERQISGYLFRLSKDQDWAKRLPGLESIGIGRRPWEATGLPGTTFTMHRASLSEADQEFHDLYLQHLESVQPEQAAEAMARISWGGVEILGRDPLAAVLRVRPPLPPLGQMYAALGIGPVLDLRGLEAGLPLDIYGLSPFAPVVFEVARPIRLLLTAGSDSSSSATILQSGIEIDGSQDTGTLGAIVSRANDGRDYLIGAQHVLGDKPDAVYVKGKKIGEVIESDPDLDVSLVQLESGLTGLPEILGINQKPNKPAIPTNSLDVQFYGAASQSQAGVVSWWSSVASGGSVQNLSFISQVNMGPPGYYTLGQPLLMEIQGSAKQGDSGALITIYHQNQKPASTGDPDLDRTLQDFISNYPHLSILGSLVGDDPGANPPKIYATQALQVAKGLNIQWRTR